MQTARVLSEAGIRFFRASLWKPRTRPGSFEGVGALGLPWLVRAREELGLQVATEVASAQHIEEALRAGLDTFWIGARTTTSPFAIAEIAEALRGCDITLLVKNPLNPDVELWEGALLRLHAAGIRNLAAVHRGFSTYARGLYRNAPLWQIPIELQRRHPGLTILVDPSHIAGKRELVPLVARMGLEMNLAGLMVETHLTPEEAWSDSAQQLRPAELISELNALDLRCASYLPQPELEALRSRIDSIDRQLLELLKQRMTISEEIGLLKAQAHLPIVQPERYRAMLEDRLTQGAALGLDEGFLRELFSSIHEASVHTQHTN